jgi:hypothetical protein
MSEPSRSPVEFFPGLHPSTRLTDELTRLLTMLREVSPGDATISFDFDGQLHIHIDVRRQEEVAALEAVLPALDGGRIHSVSRRATPHHPFFHRVSVLVAG